MTARDEVTLTLGQLSIEPGAVDRNVERAIALIDRAAQRGADIVALPELFTTGYFAFDLYSRTAEPLDGPILTRLADSAREHDVAVLAGTIVEDLAATETAATPAASGLANTAVLFDATGTRQLVYRKHHLFEYGSAESELLTPGESLPVTELCGLTVGVTTCYDLRFPELYRVLAEKGVELVLIPSAWPYPRVEHWRLLGRARAVENLCYVGAVNGSATFDETALIGRSSIYDPWGTTLASAGEKATLVSATLSPARVRSTREEFPALADRREE